MKRRWLAVLLALLMVMGTVGMAAAQEAEEVEQDEAVLTAEEEEEEGQGPPQHIQDMLVNKPDEGIGRGDEQGPPAFVLEMLDKKIHIMDRSKLMIHGNPFVSDLPPVIKKGRTLIPVADVVKGLGAESVEWDKETQTVTITSKEGESIVLQIGKNVYTVSKDGSMETFEMDTAAEILGNRTFVPLKFIAEALGEEVKWNPENRSINIGQKIAAEVRQNSEKDDDENGAILEINLDNGEED